MMSSEMDLEDSAELQEEGVTVDVYEWFNLHKLSMCLAATYVVYYLLIIVRKPIISCSDAMHSFLEAHCPIFSEKFWPTVWCIEARAQTIIFSVFAKRPHVPYEREMLTLFDGGEVALDWVLNESSTISSELQPTLIILPGLVGSSKESYAKRLAVQSMKLGFRVVVFNNRGRGGASLKTSRTYCATKTEDLTAVIEHVKKRFPGSPVMAVGVSLGGVILFNYLARTGKESGLTAAMAISVAWNCFVSAQSLEQPINAFIFNKMLAEELKQSVIRHEHLFQDKCDLQEVYNCRTIRDFDERFTARLFGYDSHKSYYHDACVDRKVHDVQVPLLCLNAADDPFSPLEAIPLDEAKKSDHVSIVVTARGGHIAFLDGLLGFSGPNYMERVFEQFFAAVFEHAGELHLPSTSSKF